MDCRAALLFSVVALLVLVVNTDGRNKKVVIHVPYKLKKIRHTHTVYRTVHHHHVDHGLSPSEEHEHFHHVHLHEDPKVGQHSKPIPGIGIPEFLPDVPLDVSLSIPDVPRHEIPRLPSRHVGIPLYKRSLDKNRRPETL